MCLHDIKAKAKKKYKATTDSKHNLPVALNLLGRQFTASAPNRVWTSDITYIDTGEGWLYLAAVIGRARCRSSSPASTWRACCVSSALSSASLSGRRRA